MPDPISVARSLAYLLLPLTVAIAVLLLALRCLWRANRPCGVRLVMLSLALLWVASMPWVAYGLARSLEAQFPPVGDDGCPRSGAIVVLGGAIRNAMVEDPYPRITAGSDRVWQAARLYLADCAPLIWVAAGGEMNPHILGTEAEAIRCLLVALGVPSKSIQYEATSLNTRQNAEIAARRLQPSDIKTILLVTSAWHLKRAEREFQSVGFEVFPVGADYRAVSGSVLSQMSRAEAWMPDPEALVQSHRMLKEHYGWWFSTLRLMWTGRG